MHQYYKHEDVHLIMNIPYYYYYYYKLYSLFCMRMVIQGCDSVREKIIIMAYNWLADRQSSIMMPLEKTKQDLEIDRMTTADW